MSYKSKKEYEGSNDSELALTDHQAASFAFMMLDFDNDPHMYCSKYRFSTPRAESVFNVVDGTSVPTEKSVRNFLTMTKLQGYGWAEDNVKDWIIGRKIPSPYEVIRRMCGMLKIEPLEVVWDEETKAINAERFKKIGELLLKTK